MTSANARNATLLASQPVTSSFSLTSGAACDGVPLLGRQDADNPRPQQARGISSRETRAPTRHAASPSGFVLRSGIVIAATPTTTQPSPIHTVELNCSPRKITPAATPIGTRK